MSEQTLSAAANATLAYNETKKALARWKEDEAWCTKRLERTRKRIADLEAALPEKEKSYKEALAALANPPKEEPKAQVLAKK